MRPLSDIVIHLKNNQYARESALTRIGFSIFDLESLCEMQLLSKRTDKSGSVWYRRRQFTISNPGPRNLKIVTKFSYSAWQVKERNRRMARLERRRVVAA